MCTPTASATSFSVGLLRGMLRPCLPAVPRITTAACNRLLDRKRITKSRFLAIDKTSCGRQSRQCKRLHDMCTKLTQTMEAAMEKRETEPRTVTADDALAALDPHWRWNRTLPAPGHTNVDFEVRVDFRRLHAYRLGRAKAALKASNLGGLLLFDVNNIRHVTGTKIGEWERRKALHFAC